MKSRRQSATPGVTDSRRPDRTDQLRARAREVDERAAEAMQLMATGRWVGGRSHQELAERWGVALSEVQHVAQRAGQALRVLMLVDREDLRARNAAHLEALAVDAHRSGEFGDAVRARAEMGKLLGLNAPEKHEHVVTYQQAEPRERLRQVEEAIAALEEEREALRDQLATVVSHDPG